MKNLLFLAFFFLFGFSFSQNIDPFAIRYQVNQKGGLRMLANASIGCNCPANSQAPPGGNGDNNGNTMSFIDIDSDPTTFMSSSDQLNLPACSEVTWAGLYWSGQLNATPSTTPNWATRGQVRLSVDGGAYQTIVANELLDNTVGKISYFGFTNITSLVQANGINSTYRIANVVGSTGNNVYGGWTIVVVYNNVYQSMRNITVFDGLANVSAGAAGTVNIPLSGFLTPPSGPVNFELGVVAHDGDRAQTGDQLAFNGAGTFVSISDAIHPVNNVFNSTISYNGVLTPLRNPSYANTLGHDANIYVPNNATFNYIGNSATNATIRVSTTSETVLTSVITSAIDIFVPDLRASVSYTDLNGGTVEPGDFLEYKIVSKNIGSDISLGTVLTDTLDPRLTYIPGTMQITYGPNSGSKSDPIDADQAEFLPATNTIRARIGTGANGINGGSVVNSSTGADSTVLRFQVQLTDDCLVWQCGPILENKAFLTGVGQISGIVSSNNGLSDLLDINGCPSLASGIVSVDVSLCADTVITHNDSLCVGEDLWLNFPNSPFLTYSWTGPDGFTSAINNPEVPDFELVNGGDYILSVTFNGVQCITDSIATIFVSDNPTLQLNTLQNDSCFNSSTGFINVSGLGNSPFTYVWSNGDADSVANDLGIGNYSVTAIDQYGCDVSASYSITQPTVLNSNAIISSNYNGQDISCFGAMDGSALASGTGGTIPYTFSWTPSLQTSAAINGLDTGTYVVTVTDANGCLSLDSVTLTQPDSLNVSGIVTDVLCFSNATGGINTTVSGGTVPYNYSWSNGAITQDLSNVIAGEYTDTVSDINGCSAVAAFTIIQPPLPLSLTDSITPILCFGLTTGSVQVNVSGGVFPYTYSWSNGNADSFAENLGAGTYNVVVTDSNLCTLTNTFTLTQPTLLVSDASITSNYNGQDISCNGAMDGSAFVVASGGVTPYAYAWLPTGQTVDSISNLDIGTYTVSVTDFNGCVVLDSVTLTQPDSLLVSAVITDVLCFGDATGAIDVSISGGTTPYNYSWSNGAITQELSTMLAGNYVDTIADVNGCSVIEAYAITQPTAPLSMTDSVVQILCFGNSTGSISLTVAGGTVPYSYVWSNGGVGSQITDLPIGTYSVVVTDSNLCTITNTFTLTQPTLLVSDASITSNYNGQDISCNGAMDGSAFVMASGGVTPYAYAWLPTGQTIDSISNLDIGTYTVSVTDFNGCVVVDSVTLTQPDSLLVSAGITDVLCFGDATGAIDVSITGGTTPYSYSWSNGAITQDLSNMLAGNYVDTITDVNGCSVIEAYAITQPTAPLSMTDSVVQILCFGDSTGSISLTVAGGTVPYSYVWSNGGVGSQIADLPIGTYSVVVTDSNLCTITNTFTLTQPTLLVSDASITSNYNGQDINCNGAMDGSAFVVASGGVTPYAYAWLPTGQIVDSISNLDIGTYTVSVTDFNGCVVLDSVTLTQPDSLLVSAVITDVLCFGDATGAIDVSIIGGTTPYNYSWSNGAITQDLSTMLAGNYGDTITDINGCSVIEAYSITQPSAPLSMTDSVVQILCFGDSTGSISLTVAGGTAPYSYVWSNGGVGSQITDLPIGTYSVVVTDSNLCTITNTFTLTQPTLLVSDASITSNYNGQDISCNGAMDGSAFVVASGGVIPYAYAWLPTGQIVDSISNLDIGTYTVSVTDFNGCVVLDSVTLTQPDSLLVSAVITDVLCFGDATGAIDVSISGGTIPYSYSWSNGAITQDLSTMFAGNYVDTITDVNGCSVIEAYAITQPTAPLSMTDLVVQILCFGDSTGSISLTVAGGTVPYSYVWSNGGVDSQITDLPIGTYSVVVTDSNLCTITSTFTLTQPTLLVSDASITSNYNGQDISCNGAMDGSAFVVASGGVTPYAYAWLPTGQTIDSISNLDIGTYTVSVTDFNGCVVLDSVTLTQPDSLVASASTIDVLCFAFETGAIDLTIVGGVLPYNHGWSNGSTTEDLSGIGAGSYTDTLTDLNGCTLLSSFVINQPADSMTITAISSEILCFNDTTASIDLTVVGGNPSYTYLWSNGSTSQDLSNLGAGTYSVTVTDSNSCVQSFSIVIDQPADLVLSETHLNPVCANGTQGSINLIVTGGTPSYNYTWNNGEFTQDISDLFAGLYFVSVVDSNGCSDTMSVVLTDPDAVFISEVISNVLCYGDSTGVVDITVSNGTLPYLYDWSNGTSAQDLTGVPTGSYFVNVSDSNGCGGFESFFINQPDTSVYISSNSSVNVLCFNDSIGTINIELAGGVAPYTYLWSNGELTQDIANLEAGIYTVVVTDSNLCALSFNDTIFQPAELELSETHVNVFCFGDSTGAIDITTIGGVEPYTFLWNTGATTEDISNLLTGNYSLTATDANNCVDTISVSISQPLAPLTLSLTQENVLCFGNNSGTIDLSVSGGTEPYSYSWNSGDTIQDLDSLVVGSYFVTVTDANGCVDTLSTTITQPTEIILTSTTNPTCFGESIGAIDLTVSGGAGGYTYAWDNGEFSQDITDLSPGIYEVTVTDANLCQATLTDTIFQPTEITITETHQNVLCFGEATGSINISVTGGVPNYTYLWDTGSPNQDLANLPIGSYELVVTDNTNCENSITVVITQPQAPISITSSVIDVFCNSGSDGSINLTVSGGTSDYTYAWDSGQTTQDISDLSAGTYTVEVTDANGCAATASVEVDEPESIDLDLSATSICFGNSDGEASVTASGGNPGYDYLWNTGNTETFITELPVGTYTVTVTDDNGCSSTASVNVGILGEDQGCVIIEMPNVFTPNGDLVNDIFLPIKLLGLVDYNLLILNRWGNVMFQSNETIDGWNGKTQTGEVATDGVYFWIVNYKDVYGNTDKVHGNVTLIRN